MAMVGGLGVGLLDGVQDARDLAHGIRLVQKLRGKYKNLNTNHDRRIEKGGVLS
jgi:hypothetical protein